MLRGKIKELQEELEYKERIVLGGLYDSNVCLADDLVRRIEREEYRRRYRFNPEPSR